MATDRQKRLRREAAARRRKAEKTTEKLGNGIRLQRALKGLRKNLAARAGRARRVAAGSSGG